MATQTSFDIDLEIVEPTEFKSKPKDDELKFGQTFTDRMLLREFKNGVWDKGTIKPFGNFSLSPATAVFHYGQEIFEGLKAFRQVNGNIVIFRPDQNAKRMISSAHRMVIPPVSEEYFLQSISRLVEMEQDWVPKKRGTALYIRPTMIATEPALGVHPSDSYYFYVILSPSGPYFKEGFSPTKIMVEDHFTRAAHGGTGAAKAGGNYGGSLLAGQRAKEQGYSQVLWLDANERKYVEEVGAMNIAFVLYDVIYTPPLSGSILPGITRKSIITLCDDLGFTIKEEALTLDDIIEGLESGNMTEIFGMGTAASVAPVGELKIHDEVYVVDGGSIGTTTQALYDELTGIQYGEKEDRHGWIHTIVEH